MGIGIDKVKKALYSICDVLQEEKEELKNLYTSMGLTATFSGLNLEFTDENIHTVALKAVSDVLMRSKPFDNITEEMMCQAIREVETAF